MVKEGNIGLVRTAWTTSECPSAPLSPLVREVSCPWSLYKEGGPPALIKVSASNRDLVGGISQGVRQYFTRPVIEFPLQ